MYRAVVQGGDWGSLVRVINCSPLFKSLKHMSKISRQINVSYGHKYVKAWHTNGAVCVTLPTPFKLFTHDDSSRQSPPKLLSHPRQYFLHLLKPYSNHEKLGLARTSWFLAKGAGYSSQQSTYPQTIGYSLADSPVGLLAWIYEKLVQWSDDYAWGDDEGLTCLLSFLLTLELIHVCNVLRENGELHSRPTIFKRPS